MFVNIMKVKIPNQKFEDLDKVIIKIEENNLWFSFEVDEKNYEIWFFREDFIWDETINFWNYIEAWKFMKELLIDLWLADNSDYKSLFSMQRIEIWDTNTEKNEEKKELFEVPKDDKKLLEALSFIKKVGKD